VFVTTSYFTKQTQEEVYADKYPVELISGGRFAGLLAQIGASSKGELKREWVEADL
jgi:restriction endonuclease Mrr